MSIFQFLLFLTFPIFINALTCETGGICYGIGSVFDKSFIPESKTCKNSCVYFKCLVDGGRVMEGGGCLEDFESVCKYVTIDVKNKLKWLKVPFQNDNLIFYSCKNGDNCAKNGFNQWMSNNANVEEFGKFVEKRPDLKCDYENTPMKFPQEVICESSGFCVSGKEYFDLNSPTERKIAGKKKCVACIDFKCKNNGGKNVVIGNGCYEDLLHACPVLRKNITEMIERSKKHFFYYDKNVIIGSCFDSIGCDKTMEKFNEVHGNKIEETFAIDKNADKSCNYNPLPIKSTTTTRRPYTNANVTTTDETSTSSSPLMPTSENQKQNNSDNAQTSNFKPNGTQIAAFVILGFCFLAFLICIVIIIIQRCYVS